MIGERIAEIRQKLEEAVPSVSTIGHQDPRIELASSSLKLAEDLAAEVDAYRRALRLIGDSDPAWKDMIDNLLGEE